MLSTRCTRFKREHVNPTTASALGDIAVIDLEGPDAERFAQAQSMNDVAALAVGHWHWNGWLSPKGRVQALFALLHRAPGQLRLLLLDAEPAAFVADLSRYLLRSKVRFRHRDDLQVVGGFDPEPMTQDPPLARNALLPMPDGDEMLDVGAVGGQRWLGIRPAPLPIDPFATARWRAADLRHGLPRWRPDQVPTWTPHMLSLQRLRAFSVKKGCYPGQEIVARTHYLGEVKRQTWWLEGEALAAGQSVLGGDGAALGSIVDATADGRGALAVLTTALPPTLRAGAGEVRASSPLSGLER